MVGSLQVVLLLASGGVGAVGAGVSSTGEVGVRPVQAGAPSQQYQSLAIVPAAGVRWHSRTSEALAIYAPRFYLLHPNQSSLGRPLVLHQIRGVARHLSSPRLAWTLSTGLRFGEVDYTALSLVFDGPPSALPDNPALSLFAATAGAGVSWAATRNLSLSLSADWGHQESLEDTTQSIPAQSRFGLAARLSATVDRRTLVFGELEGGYVEPGLGTTYISSQPTVGVERQLSADTRGTLSAGVGVLVPASESSDVPPSDALASPVVDAGVDTVLYRYSEAQLDGFGSTSLLLYVDPVQGIPLPRAGGALGGSYRTRSRWTHTLTTSFFTNATGEPLTPLGASSAVPETVLSVALGASHPIDHGLGINFGARFTSRGPHVTVGPPTNEVIVAGFVGIGAAVTSDSRPDWMQAN